VAHPTGVRARAIHTNVMGRIDAPLVGLDIT
jgi:hypothetical protein